MGSGLSEEWREYLISLIQEEREHRERNAVFSDFFERLREKMPLLIVPPNSPPTLVAKDWALVIHAACDRFHAFFAGSLLRAKDPGRSPLGALHDVKRALSHLYDSAVKGTLEEMQLIDFRRRVRDLTPTAEELLKKALSDWRPSWFDLRAELDRPAGVLIQVFGQKRLGVEILGNPHLLLMVPKKQVLAAYRELLYNARGYDEEPQSSPSVKIEFQGPSVVIRNRLHTHFRSKPYSTGKGVIAANKWLEECGFTVVHERTAEEYTVRITKRTEPQSENYGLIRR